MDIKYNVSKYKDSKIQEVKDSVSIEEPLEMRLKFKKNGKPNYFCRWVATRLELS